MGIPRTRGLLYSPWQPLGILFAITPIGQLHQSLPSPIPGDLGRGPSHQSHVLEHRDTYGQAQVCSKGHQWSSVDHPCQPSFHWSKFWHLLGHCGSRGYSRRPRCFWRILYCDKCASDKNRHRHLLLVYVFFFFWFG